MAGILDPEKDELNLVYASPDASFAHQARVDETVVERARSSLSSAVFDEATSRLTGAWQERVHRKEMAGWAGAALIEAIKELGADLIAVGFRGTSLFERFILGSVSRSIIHSAPVPVLVVKSVIRNEQATEEPAHSADEKFHSLVAYDGTAVGDRIAAIAGQLTWPPNTVGEVMTVVPPMFVAEMPEWLKHKTRDPDVAAMASAWQAEHDQSVAEARQKLEQFQLRLPACFSQTSAIVEPGRPAEKILEHLHAHPVDLVIAGSRGAGKIERLLVGSTSERLLTTAPCSVLIVR